MRFLSILILLLSVILGCGRNYYTYTIIKPPSHINHPKTIPVYLDVNFTENQRKDIMAAFHEWNYVFNGQIIIKVEDYIYNLDDAEKKYVSVSKTGLGWIILKKNEDDELIKNIIRPGDLAFVPGLKSNIMVVIGDRIGTRNLKTIIMHETGHLFGARHINAPSLMMTDYGETMYSCIDKITVLQVATTQELDFKSLNYCITPFFE